MINFLAIIIIFVIVVYLWYVFAVIYHLIRFGIGRLPKMTALIFFVFSVFLLVLAIFLLFYFGKISQEVILEKIIQARNFFKK